MASKQDKILEYIIEIKDNVGDAKGNIKAIEQHLRTLNGTVQRHEKEISNLQKTVWKFAGGIALLIGIIQFVIAKIL